MKKNYELACLIPVETTEEETRSFSDRIESIIKQGGGEATKAKKPLIKKLGCPIKKNREAIFLVFEFTIEKESLLALEKNIKLENRIIRMMISEKKKIVDNVRIDRLIERETTSIPEIEAKEEPKITAFAETIAVKEEKKEIKETNRLPKFEKVEIGEIDKKIEEMLKD